VPGQGGRLVILVPPCPKNSGRPVTAFVGSNPQGCALFVCERMVIAAFGKFAVHWDGSAPEMALPDKSIVARLGKFQFA